jgi:hypothetical protein
MKISAVGRERIRRQPSLDFEVIEKALDVTLEPADGWHSRRLLRFPPAVQILHRRLYRTPAL